MKNISKELKDRGFISQEGGGDSLEFLNTKRKVYLGIDPTADSLHLGHLVPILLMRHLSDAGHDVSFLVGGGTGMIGDPRESGERPLIDKATVSKNTIAIKNQLSKILGKSNYKIFNNAEWLSKLGIIEFLRDIAKHFTVNQLVKRELIKNRLESEDPISFTEFSYSLLQAYDFLHLHKKYKIDLQIGGSDQWTNIISGVDLIRRIEEKSAFALTTPIITDNKTGKKFGKSEGNAIWLDPNKTSPFEFYQFWMNVSDDNVENYLKIFTLLTLEEIKEVVSSSNMDSQKRIGQKKLAFEVTKIIHSKEKAEAVSKISEILYGNNPTDTLQKLKGKELSLIIKESPGVSIKTKDIKKGISILDVLLTLNLVPSKSEARRFIEGNGVYFNDIQVKDSTLNILAENLINGVGLFKVGKKVSILKLVK